MDPVGDSGIGTYSLEAENSLDEDGVVSARKRACDCGCGEGEFLGESLGELPKALINERTVGQGSAEEVADSVVGPALTS